MRVQSPHTDPGVLGSVFHLPLDNTLDPPATKSGACSEGHKQAAQLYVHLMLSFASQTVFLMYIVSYFKNS